MEVDCVFSYFSVVKDIILDSLELEFTKHMTTFFNDVRICLRLMCLSLNVVLF